AQRRLDCGRLPEDARGLRRDSLRGNLTPCPPLRDAERGDGRQAASGLSDPAPQGHVALRVHQYDVPVSQHHTERQDFREEIRDLARWKVYSRQAEPSHGLALLDALRYLI